MVDMHCGCCVCPSRVKSKVVVRNRKYCWLYPYYERKQLRKSVPTFDDHKTLYTKCDFILEQCAHKKILDVERLLKEYAQLFEVEIKLQKSLLSAMWIYATRYTVLTRGGVCIKLYPEVVSQPMQGIEKCRYDDNYQKLHASL